MKLLVLGGGVFAGAALVDAALRQGHAVTVFNRGLSRSRWPAGVEALTGDRRADLLPLAGRRWDAVVDVCGYVPAEVRASAEALRDGVGVYLFVSSVSAYASFRATTVDEDEPLAGFDGIDPQNRDRALYGPQKAACEAELRRAFGARALCVRPGLLIGPGDPTGRFSHWPWRVAAGGEVLVPAVPDDTPLQFLDVRDLAAWLVRLLEGGVTGVFNANGPLPAAACSWPALLAACADEAVRLGFTPARAVRVDEAQLLEAGVQPWNELPLWLPSTDADLAGLMRIDLRRCAAAGLTTRPLHDTVADVLGEGLPAADDPRRAGKLTTAREAALIAASRAERRPA